MQPKKPININAVTDMGKLKALLAGAAIGGKRKQINKDELEDHLKARIKGQDQALDQIARAVYAGWAKQERQRPITACLLVGPPGTGKTETAKALESYLFDNEKDLLTVNGAEYKNAGEAVSKLIGVGAAYKGSDQGGTLTRPMFGRKERVVLFDEVEKMHPECYDLFLSMLQDGYVVEQGANKKADFTSTVVLITSNKDHEKCAEIANAYPNDPKERTRAFKAHFNASGFMRPEIFDRIPHIIYFQPLNDEVWAELAVLKIAQMVQNEYDLTLANVEPEAVMELIANVRKGGGGIRDFIQTAEDRLGDSLADLAHRGEKSVGIVLRNGAVEAIPAVEKRKSIGSDLDDLDDGGDHPNA